jgi:hypothetical protein
MGAARREGVVGPPGTPPPDAMWGSDAQGPSVIGRPGADGWMRLAGRGRLLIMDWRLLRERDRWVGLAGTGCELIVSCGDENPGDHCDSLIL